MPHQVMCVRDINGLFGRVSAALLLAFLLMASFVLFCPGIVMSDTMARWAAVFTILGDINYGWSLEQWLSPVMTMFMLPVAMAGLPSGVFSFFQVLYLLLSGFVWVFLTSSRFPIWIPFVFVFPLVFVYVSFIVPDVWALSALISMAGSLVIIERGKIFVGGFCLLFSCVVLFGFRLNSLLLVPVLVILAFYVLKLRRIGKLVVVASIFISNVAIVFVPSLIGFGERTSSAAAPAWELVGMLRVASEAGVKVDPGLTLEGIGSSQAAIAAHSFSKIDTLLWGENASLPAGVILDKSSELKARWIGMILENPFIYFRTKLEIYKCMIGLCDEYLQVQLTTHNSLPELGRFVNIYQSNSGVGGLVLDFANWTGGTFTFLMTPAFWAPLSLLVFVFSWGSYGQFDRLLLFLSSFYFASFFVLNQAGSFRYMFPVYVVFTAYQIRFLGWGVFLAWSAVKSRRECK